MPLNEEVNMDFDRENRTGLAEAVFCEGKSDSQLVSICERIRDEDRPMLFTRLARDVYERLAPAFSDMIDYDEVSRTGFHRPAPERDCDSVAVVTGGSSDVPVAREAARTFRFYGYQSLAIDDAGVAGLWRITERLDELRRRKVVICIAGMDAALPTVLGGLIPGVLIAVPSSAGYGMTRGGETALQSLLCSC
ncbi:MAG: nickel pincer cofactor biosynthesis protein LarB, partial [Pseudomonadales bacterium]|nr:nickel pincer cofactor biosynthesis protein LarB [Pseudomonadales bacterium]